MHPSTEARNTDGRSGYMADEAFTIVVFSWVREKRSQISYRG